jgi:hypothetical protein
MDQRSAAKKDPSREARIPAQRTGVAAGKNKSFNQVGKDQKSSRQGPASLEIARYL